MEAKTFLEQETKRREEKYARQMELLEAQKANLNAHIIHMSKIQAHILVTEQNQNIQNDLLAQITVALETIAKNTEPEPI